MGCVGSKLDDLQAVALCRERSNLLEAAIRHRYALAQAHLSYLRSLKSVASSLERFFDLDPSSSPFLPLPSPRKGDPDPDLAKLASSSPIAAAHPSHSNSGSHLDLNSDSDSEAPGSPLHDDDGGGGEHGAPHQTLDQIPTRYYANYASTGPTPSIAYEQRPWSPEAVRFEEPYPNPSTSYSYSSYSDPYPNYGGSGGFFGSPPAQHSGAAAASQAAPPPPPPEASDWEFFNPFETSLNYYASYTPSRNSKDVREEEGIPDLEDEGHQDEVVKVVDGGGGGGHLKAGVGDGDREIGGKAVGEEKGVEYEVHVVEKKVVVNEERDNVAPVKAGGLRDVSEVVSKIKAEFDRAADSGREMAKILEAGRLPYRGKNAVYKVSSRMLDVIAPLSVVSSELSPFKATATLPSTDSLSLDFEDGATTNSKSLSSTLDKLYIWEKKLCEEVKAEEKMRIIHERKSRKLKHLDESGAEAHKIESARALVRNLSTKIRISLQFVDSISTTITNLRDDDLWPQIDELIHGLVRMWKVMLECHQSQCQIITEAGNLNVVASSRKFSDSYMEATMHLEQEMLNLILSFYAWISALKSYVKALNGWLLMCIHYEPEETADGVAPFSPGRIGAPPAFVICNHWSQVMDRISEKEVFEAMQAFSVSVLQLWDQYCLVQRQKMMANKDMDRKLKLLEREEQKMQKSLDVVNKKLALVSEQNGLPPPGQIVHQSHSASDNDNSLESGLRQIFEAMERFSESCMRTYEELCLHSEEYKVARENAKAP